MKRATVRVAPALMAAASAFVLISVDTEIELGRRAQAETVRQVKRIADPVVTAYVRDVGRALVAEAGGPRFPYSFDVADKTDINAFALPGGPVWVHRGALVTARTEAELAGVLAHEIAHVARRHTAAQASAQIVSHLGFSLLSALLGNTFSASTTEGAAQALAGGVLLKFSRDDERDADASGVAMMARAGWDPRGLAEFLERLSVSRQRQPSAVEVFFSTHPATGERIASLHAAARPLARGRRTSREFEAMRARLIRSR